MATARTETTPPKKSTPPENPGKSAGESAGSPAADKAAAATAPAGLLAERYRDTAYEALVGTNGENVTAVMSAGEAMFSGLAEISQEMMDFAGSRLRADMECAEDFSKASSPEDLFEKQCSFARNAAQHYAEHTSKLIGMMARIQQSCWAPMELCTKQALHGMNGANGKDAANGKDEGKKK